MGDYLKIKKGVESQYKLENGSNLFTENSTGDIQAKSELPTEGASVIDSNVAGVTSGENDASKHSLVNKKDEADASVTENLNVLNENDSDDAEKGNGYTWPQSLKMAILTSEDQKLTVDQIYEYIKREFPYYRTTNQEKTDKWKRVVRTNLSGRKKIFQRECPKFATGQWKVIDEDGKKPKRN